MGSARPGRVNLNVEEGHRIAIALEVGDTTSFKVDRLLQRLAADDVRAETPYAQIPTPWPEPGNAGVCRLYLWVWLALRSHDYRNGDENYIPFKRCKPKHVERVREHIRGLLALHRARPNKALGPYWEEYLQRALRRFPAKPERLLMDD
jgi:hypothetical protein